LNQQALAPLATRSITGSAAVWSLIGDFCSDWHEARIARKPNESSTGMRARIGKFLKKRSAQIVICASS
jgi:hypothetical protein